MSEKPRTIYEAACKVLAEMHGLDWPLRYGKLVKPSPDQEWKNPFPPRKEIADE